MSREVRRVPLDWEHPMEWRQIWDRGLLRTKRVSRPLLPDYARSLASWEQGGRDLEARTGFDWDFWHRYCLTGYQGREDAGPTIHPFEGGIVVRDSDHLAEMLREYHESQRPDPDDYMPDFSAVPDDAMGVAMYETTSEGTPISPAFRTPEGLAEWLAVSRATTFGNATATSEEWLPVCRGGWAPTAVVTSGGRLLSGVAAMAELGGDES